MEHLPDMIWRYGDLTADERREVDAFVAAHPEHASFLEEARRLYGLLRGARLLDRPGVDDDLLAYYITTSYLSRHPAPVALRPAFERVQARVAQDPHLQARYDALRLRLEAVTAAAADPFEQFEQLTGHRLERPEAAPPPAPRPRPAPRAPDRSARIYRLHRPLAWAFAAAVLGVALYGVLLFAGRAALSDTERLGLIDPSTLALDGYEVRGMSLPALDELYLQGLRQLRDAHTTTLGLFPRYDAAQLEAAQAIFQHVLAQTEDDPTAFVRLEAAYYLAKTRLYQGDVAEARELLEQVVAQEGLHAEDARQVLAALES